MRTSAAQGNDVGLLATILLIPLWLAALDGSARAEEPDTNPDQDLGRGDRLSFMSVVTGTVRA